MVRELNNEVPISGYLSPQIRSLNKLRIQQDIRIQNAECMNPWTTSGCHFKMKGIFSQRIFSFDMQFVNNKMFRKNSSRKITVLDNSVV